MKHRLLKMLNWVYLTTLIFFTAGLLSSFAQGSKTIANEAFLLRMEGKADSAKAILKNHLESVPCDALAWFELSRTLDHIRLGNPQQAFENEEVLKCLDQAMKCEPQNGLYTYSRGVQETLNLYIALMMEKSNEEIIASLKKAEKLFSKAIELDKKYIIGKVTMVELYGQLPKEMGGDKDRASKLAEEVMNIDAFWGNKAQSMLLEEGSDEVQFWIKAQEEIGENPLLYEALGKSYLHQNDVDQAIINFEKAIKLEKSLLCLELELGRYYMMQIMMNYEKKEEFTPHVEKYFTEYLEKCPETTNPVKAWIYGHLAKIKMHSGQQEAGKKLMEKANQLDPHHSKAFGFPPMDLAPELADKNLRHSYYFRPF